MGAKPKSGKNVELPAAWPASLQASIQVNLWKKCVKKKKRHARKIPHILIQAACIYIYIYIYMYIYVGSHRFKLFFTSAQLGQSQTINQKIDDSVNDDSVGLP